jgi:hypothetical protein
MGKRTGERDVVKVMSCSLVQRAILPVPGHPPVHKPRVSGQAFVRTESEALHYAGPEALKQHVGGAHQVEQRRAAVRVLEVDGDVATPAQRDLTVWRLRW